MPMRNRRVRLLILAVLLTIVFFVYTRSDPKTIDQAKRYAQSKYQQALELSKQKATGQPPAQNQAGAPAPDIKKDEPFRVDFGAYSRAAAGVFEEATGAVPPPPAAPVPPPPALETKTTAVPGPLETKKDDPMRVDFAAYSKAAAPDPEETKAPSDPMKMDTIANPNPIVGVDGPAVAKNPALGKDDSKSSKPDTKESKDSKDTKQEKPKPKPGLTQQQPPQYGAPAAPADGLQPVGEGRVEIDVQAVETSPPVHWSKFPEKYPITTTRAFPFNRALPTATIQYNFKTGLGGGADAEKLAQIKDATKHAWNGYSSKAMGHDEIKPVSGQFANPFNAWGATLIDALDTLWLMGMTDEFEAALKYVATVDFTTSRRADIPLFETVIRYMGGLLGAYEITGRNEKYKVLLDKAAELGEVLYAAFDTPNRMPLTYYQWKPAFASQGHRAGTRTIMAELGSLSLEFTRLGQLVANPKYFDAISRITDALDEFQDKTRVPGLWPAQLDASGCKVTKAHPDGTYEALEKAKTKDTSKETKPDPKTVPDVLPGKTGLRNEKAASDPLSQSSVKTGPDTPIGLGQAGLGKIAGFDSPLQEGSLDTASAKESMLKAANNAGAIMRRALDAVKDAAADLLDIRADPGSKLSSRQAAAKPADTTSAGDEAKEGTRAASQAVITADDACIPQGLASLEYGSDVYTLGAAADSTYEYLPKMHLLLGGRVDQYQKMYVKAIEASMKSLIYRPMIPDEKRELLFAGNVDTKVKTGVPAAFTREFNAVGSHLTCFVGGMFGLGGKIFNRPQDVETAKKLTDGCIWAYNVTTTGIMPEIFSTVKCDSMEKCKWDQSKYWKALDPFVESRLGDSGNTAAGASAAAADKPVVAQAAEKVAAADKPVVAQAAEKAAVDKPVVAQAAEKVAAAVAPAVDKVAAGAEKVAAGFAAAAAPAAAKPAVDQAAAAQAIAPPVGLPAGKAGLAKRQFGGGEAQYGVQTAPAVAPGAAVNVVPEVPPLHMGVPGSPNANGNAPEPDEPVLNIPVGDNPNKQLLSPTDNDATPFEPMAQDLPMAGLTVDTKQAPAGGLPADTKSLPAVGLPVDTKPAPAVGLPAAPAGADAKLPIGAEPALNEPAAKSVKPADIKSSSSSHDPVSHEEFVKKKIADERLPPGMVGMHDKRYQLRPEAIESVFYMYRITGEQYWRDRGWEMWNAIYKHTQAKFGATAIDDVSKNAPEPADSEESFWLAETLKYFYLLFDDPERFSLDDWVLNTEAHFLSTSDIKLGVQ